MNSISVFGRVVWALINREALTRNGRWRFGYIWAFAEPAFYIIGFVLFRTFLSNQVPFGENSVIYLITAIITFRTAMGLTRRTMGAIQSNISLLTYPKVKTFDVIIARIILEAITWIAITIFFIFGLYFFTGQWAALNLERFLAGYGATLLFGASFGIFNATFVRIFPFWDRILSLAALPLFFVSGLFFLPSAMPPELLNWLWWNPYLHLVEWVRSGVYLDYPPFLTPAYVLGLSFVMLLIGLILNRFCQRRMILG